ncbi:hypothetical protein A3D62_01980 [Candidatus Kaiserbacteria bacterium RIFCSPHIGHO2_02_FULL_49_11]|uniref:tRNA/rRNA methyltransferase SpoU type domain-containing protein n=1 Tax=Candidatus Kaiserbacteria bacterium RIFCSPHIGHO2_02_FULL_49_11 TaxID=1798489 RepID=A0A1F6CZ48_9BACT|nr:MAG: hypothetical protein A3D62_01980 [Candidatus Kaiserbacteria bacterium RIFCSPHIGHO2_02_FULL_49_11]
MRERVVILHNIRSTHNVGSIFRTADAAGISKIFLTGYTPAPLDRFLREAKSIAKVALGAEKTVPWEKVLNLGALLNRLKKDGYSIVAVEQSKRSKDYRTWKGRGKAALIFGNEVRGLSSAVLQHSNLCIEIPMQGSKESLNVSVAAGIILFHQAL